MHNDFTPINRRRRKNKRNSSGTEAENLFARTESSVREKLKRAIEEFESSQFCFDLLQSIDSTLKLIKIDSIGEIICYGLGNFSDSKSALHQLAVLVIFYEKYKALVRVYDPIFNSIEVKLLQSLNFEVLSENEEGKRKIDNNRVSLIFLPHCPKQLINNFLWANWNIALKNCILITNSFSKIIEDCTKKSLDKSANFISIVYPKTKEIFFENNYHINNSFNDISIHYFDFSEQETSFFVDNSGKEPVYSEDTEFIAKNIEILNIKNG